jgi:acetyltransferase-like isoleucine patch superfamily enzyme
MAVEGILQLPELLIRHFLELVQERRLRSKLIKQNMELSLGKRVEIRSPERLHLGKGVMIDSGVLLHCGGMAWSDGRGGIRIGDNSYIGPNSVLFGAGGIEIGTCALISPGVVITSHQHTFAGCALPMREQPVEFAPVVIEDNVWIGSNATVLPGVTIETGSVIGAGAVVTKDVPARSLCLGVPARIVREI